MHMSAVSLPLVCLSSVSDQQGQIDDVLHSAVESDPPSKWTANNLNLESARAKQVARLLALATDDQHSRVSLNAFNPSVLPLSFTELAHQPRAGIAASTANNDPMDSSDNLFISLDTLRCA
ncbi:hypothetical protein BCR37DRAFT_380602 [Protomyces lactucae-debilis]|uniref:Uncharacterized protein n=1 Tax=Protomyces lactucae-debilis TaxID=2754530 RepID=A0A1Y2FA90_PROLT|nr:uncharacterized protein BCR37DRAFT_380602 [Protomyces lactucae-debilis]ORY80829.1 hypothetical protein BCR37DRAFT_380602 [Protomyces lactucae-debilis]